MRCALLVTSITLFLCLAESQVAAGEETAARRAIRRSKYIILARSHNVQGRKSKNKPYFGASPISQIARMGSLVRI
ncbi:hypothetical protein C8R45DRAFT_1038525 [Mycena sanguinolenta]|nr:hypothetical protein C8R45DRAFT_1038525 [Mycena sanguinolenta]